MMFIRHNLMRLLFSHQVPDDASVRVTCSGWRYSSAAFAFLILLAGSALPIRADTDNARVVSDATDLSMRGDFYAAIEMLTSEINRTPPNSKLYAIRGLAHFQAGDHDKALSDFDEALRLDHQEWLAWGGQGRVHLRTKNYPAALLAFDKAIELRAEWAFYVGRSDANVGLDRFDAALKDINTAIDVGKDDKQFQQQSYQALIRRAEIYEKLQKLDLAMQDFEVARGMNPLAQAATDGALRVSSQGQQIIDLCSNDKIRDIELKSGFNGEFDDPSISSDMWRDYLNKELAEMQDLDFSHFEKAVRDCLSSARVDVEPQREMRILASVSAIIQRARADRDAMASVASSKQEDLPPEEENILSMLSAYFQKYSIAQLCHEAGNTFEASDIDKLKSGITEVIKNHGMQSNTRVMNVWEEISRHVNLNRHLLSQGDCTQASQWFSYSLPTIKIGKSTEFPFQ